MCTGVRGHTGAQENCDNHFTLYKYQYPRDQVPQTWSTCQIDALTFPTTWVPLIAIAVNTATLPITVSVYCSVVFGWVSRVEP
jgi:hypothetical protein